MAQSVKASPIGGIKPTGRKPGRPAAARTVVASQAPTPRRSPKAVAAPPKATKTTKAAVQAPAVAPALKVSKDELRAQVGKLEQLVATFRVKSRETSKAAKAAAARISDLEAQVARLEKQAAAAPASPRQAKSSRASRPGREIDPGDAVPPGVAVQEPAPLDEEAVTALEHLEEHLGHS
ncbi:MAG: hypothetical protein ACRYGI_04955 [Janthinobacterium lividum]